MPGLDAAAQAAADAPPLVLEHLTTADGLPQGTVFSTLQDSQGFVWWTEDGLVRYDGHDLVRYADTHSTRGGLPGNFINQIVEDAHHDLWIATRTRPRPLEPGDDSFTVYRHDPANPGSLASDAVHNVLVDARGRIWVGTSDAGIDILEPATGHIRHLRHDAANANSLIDDHIYTLTLDRSGTLWVGTEAGLDEWQPNLGAFIPFRHSAGDLTPSRAIRSIESWRTGAAPPGWVTMMGAPTKWTVAAMSSRASVTTRTNLHR